MYIDILSIPNILRFAKTNCMKTQKIIYWATTAIVAGMMLMSSGMSLSGSKEMTENFSKLGYPPYFLYILGTSKLLGVIGILQPVSYRLREWAYAGFSFVFIGAIWTHLATNTPFRAAAFLLVFVLISSFLHPKVRAN